MAKKMKVVKPKDRFYFWESIPSYGVRQMGATHGYSSLAALKKDMVSEIKYNKTNNHPTFIMKSKVIKRLV